MIAEAVLALSLAWTGTAPSKPGPAVPKAAEAWAEPADLEGLLAASLRALDARDTAGLERLTVGRREFLGAYPGFAVDTTAERREFALGYFLADNRKLMLRGLSAAGSAGRGLALARFEVEGPVERYGDATLFRGLRLWVRKDSSAAEFRFLRSAAKTPSGWRIWSFSDD